MRQARILLIDDDRNFLRVLTYQIEEFGFRPFPTSTPREALERVRAEDFDLVITDLRMPEMDGLELITEIRRFNPELPIIVLTAHGSIDKAVEAVKLGATDFLTKPFEKPQMRHSIGKTLRLADLLVENRRLARAVQEKFEFGGIAGSSKSFREVIDLARQLSAVDTTVLIQGESGTGKELIARAIHFNSRRREKPFMVVNCGAIPEALVESELFGYRKGAFTGATSNRQGKFEAAEGGTLFLDEVGELPPATQVKLLRAIQQKEIDVIGDPHPQPSDVRILAATNRDLLASTRKGEFREDLFYRLSVVPLTIPPLRERREDIPLLVHHLADSCSKRLEKELTFDQEVLQALRNYPWPGNVRELENIIERLAVFSRTGRITEEDLPPDLRESAQSLGKLQVALPEEGLSLEEVEKDLLLAALGRHNWNQTRAARYLGISRNTLIYRMHKYGLKPGEAKV